MSQRTPVPLPVGRRHLDALVAALDHVRADTDRVDGWARHLSEVLPAGARLLAAGNGGSAAQAQHLTSELVGRYRDDRPPVSAIALHADTSSLTAISNDYGAAQAFARQVEAHGRAGDVLVVLSTSGRSSNVVAAAVAARRIGITTWALTGPAPNPLAARCDDSVCVAADATATVQEVHQVVVHLLCAGYDVATGASRGVDAARAEATR
jgi:D-sedoheptulose 7-phosphate isomerase